MSLLEMPSGDGALAVAYVKAASPCSTRRCRKSCPAEGRASRLATILTPIECMTKGILFRQLRPILGLLRRDTRSNTATRAGSKGP